MQKNDTMQRNNRSNMQLQQNTKKLHIVTMIIRKPPLEFAQTSSEISSKLSTVD